MTLTDEEQETQRIALADRYLALVRQSVMGLLFGDIAPDGEAHRIILEGRGHADRGITMLGLKRIENLVALVEDVLERGVHGDLIEAGVWRGGAAILMRAVLEARGDRHRKVHVADSFIGLPEPTHPEDVAWNEARGDVLRTMNVRGLAVPIEHVMQNFSRYGFLDERTVFWPGWFRDTLKNVPGPLALVRLDGDMYDSTMDSLRALYPKLSSGGYVIVDDYGAFECCRRAVDDYRAEHAVDAPVTTIDWAGAFWMKP